MRKKEAENVLAGVSKWDCPNCARRVLSLKGMWCQDRYFTEGDWSSSWVMTPAVEAQQCLVCGKVYQKVSIWNERGRRVRPER